MLGYINHKKLLMKKSVYLLSIIFTTLFVSAQTGIPVPEMTACDTEIENFMSTFSIPSLTVALAKDGELKYMRSFGNADIAGTTATQPYHMFRIASVSKPITSIGIMKMMEDGLLSMDDMVFGAEGILENHWYFSNSSIIDSRVYDITVQMLLEHSAGWDRSVDCFPNPTTPYPWFFSGCDPIIAPLHVTQILGESNPVIEEYLIGFLLEKNLDFTPNTQYAYSNIGYLILSEIIEEISGVSYEEYMQQEIFNPLGIYDMYLAGNLLSDKQEREGEYIGNGYTTLDIYGNGNTVPWEYGGLAVDAMDGHGGWIATARDMVRLLVAVDGFTTKPDILLPATINTMVAPSTNNANYAKGWLVNTSNNWWHNGTIDGTASYYVRSSNGYTWAIITNYREVGGNSNAFWNGLDAIGWNCISNTGTFPSWDLMDSPTVPASNIVTGGSTNMNISWTNGNGNSRIVVIKDITNNTDTYNFSAYPLDGTDYTANTAYGSGDNLGDGTYVVYNGSGNNVTVTGLDVSKTYAIRVYEYTKNSNNGNNALYLLGGAPEKESVLGLVLFDLSSLIRLYPTVTSSQVTVKITDAIGRLALSYTMYDLRGRILQTGKLNSQTTMIEVSDLASGVYLLMVNSGENKAVLRFIKQ